MDANALDAALRAAKSRGKKRKLEQTQKPSTESQDVKTSLTKKQKAKKEKEEYATVISGLGSIIDTWGQSIQHATSPAKTKKKKTKKKPVVVQHDDESQNIPRIQLKKKANKSSKKLQAKKASEEKQKKQVQSSTGIKDRSLIPTIKASGKPVPSDHGSKTQKPKRRSNAKSKTFITNKLPEPSSSYDTPENSQVKEQAKTEATKKPSDDASVLEKLTESALFNYGSDNSSSGESSSSEKFIKGGKLASPVAKAAPTQKTNVETSKENKKSPVKSANGRTGWNGGMNISRKYTQSNTQDRSDKDNVSADALKQKAAETESSNESSDETSVLETLSKSSRKNYIAEESSSDESTADSAIVQSKTPSVATAKSIPEQKTDVSTIDNKKEAPTKSSVTTPKTNAGKGVTKTDSKKQKVVNKSNKAKVPSVDPKQRTPAKEGTVVESPPGTPLVKSANKKTNKVDKTPTVSTSTKTQNSSDKQVVDSYTSSDSLSQDTSIADVHAKYALLKPNKRADGKSLSVSGVVSDIKFFSLNLFHLIITSNDQSLSLVCRQKQFKDLNNHAFIRFSASFDVGDKVEASGVPGKSKDNIVQLHTTSIVKIVSPVAPLKANAEAETVEEKSAPVDPDSWMEAANVISQYQKESDSESEAGEMPLPPLERNHSDEELFSALIDSAARESWELIEVGRLVRLFAAQWRMDKSLTTEFLVDYCPELVCVDFLEGLSMHLSAKQLLSIFDKGSGDIHVVKTKLSDALENHLLYVNDEEVLEYIATKVQDMWSKDEVLDFILPLVESLNTIEQAGTLLKHITESWYPQETAAFVQKILLSPAYDDLEGKQEDLLLSLPTLRGRLDFPNRQSAEDADERGNLIGFISDDDEVEYGQEESEEEENQFILNEAEEGDESEESQGEESDDSGEESEE